MGTAGLPRSSSETCSCLLKLFVKALWDDNVGLDDASVYGRYNHRLDIFRDIILDFLDAPVSHSFGGVQASMVRSRTVLQSFLC